MNPPANMQETRVRSLHQEDPLSSVLAWKIPWSGEPGRLQSTGSHRVRHKWSNLAHTHADFGNIWTSINANFLICKMMMLCFCHLVFMNLLLQILPLFFFISNLSSLFISTSVLFFYIDVTWILSLILSLFFNRDVLQLLQLFVSIFPLKQSQLSTLKTHNPSLLVHQQLLCWGKLT